MEFGTVARRTALSCCVALVAAGSFTCPAAADPRSADLVLPAGLSEAVKRDLGIDPAEYLTRAERTHRLAEFGKAARIAHPVAFAGIRMEGDRAIVSLADGVSAERARTAAEEAGFTVETVADSEATLRGRRTVFERWLAGQTRSVAESIVGYGIDVAHNSFAVRLAKDVQLPAEAGPVRSVAAVLPEARPDDAPISAQSIAAEEASGDVIGGQAYAVELGGKTAYCSFGFNGTDGEGHAVNITAGHCDPGNLVEPAKKTSEPQRVFATQPRDRAEVAAGELPLRGTELGYFDVSRFNPHDYAIVRINKADAPRFQNNLVSARRLPQPSSSVDTAGSVGQLPAGSSGAGAERQEVVRIDGTTEPVAGSAVCKSGFRSGYSCGFVIAAGQIGMMRGLPGNDDPVQVQDMFYTSVCAQRGDSGGPIMAGTKAVGINSAIVPNVTPLDGACGHLPVLVGQPISTVLRDNPGMTIRTS